MRHPLPCLAAVLVLAAAPALAQKLPPAVSSPAEEAATYDRCMEMARTDPPNGYEFAQQWYARNGEHPAQHCIAVALFSLKQYGEAAVRFQKLAESMVRAPKELRGEMLDQAGVAWFLADELPRAKAALDTALTLKVNDPDILIDHAQVLAAQGSFPQAINDLDLALKINPRRADALVYRASALRQIQRLDPALKDVEAALSLSPDSPDGLLERGIIRRLKGDDAGARQDWIKVTLLAPGSPADTDAKANLERLDYDPAKAGSGVPGRGR